MTFISDITGALPELRAAAESRMTDTCRITAPGVGQGPWNTGAGKYDAPAPVVVYEGKCRIKRPALTNEATASAAGPEVRDVSGSVLCLPINGTESVGAKSQTVEYLTAVFDQSLVGHKFGVAGGTQSSQQTERRIRLKESVG